MLVVILLDLIKIVKHVIAFENFLVVGNFYNFVPHVQTHNFESFALFTLPKNFEIIKWNFFSNLTHPKPQFPWRHDLVSLKVVIFLDPEFANIFNLGVQLGWMHKELLFFVHEGILRLD